MATNTIYIAQFRIKNLNGKSYAEGDTVTGLSLEQEQYLSLIKAIALPEFSEDQATGNSGDFETPKQIFDALLPMRVNSQKFELSVMNRITRAKSGVGLGSGSLTIVGDSITEGVGATLTARQYASRVRDAFLSYMGGGYGYETITNFAALDGMTIAGTTSFGTKGPCKKSLIMQPNATITFTRDIAYLDVFFHKTPTSGSLEIRKNGTLMKTLNLSGTETANALSFPSSSWTSENTTYEIKCVGAQVELTGILTLKSAANVMHINRIAVSGFSTSDYIGAETLASLNAFGTFFAAQGVFVLGLGTNDIYSDTKAVTPKVFKQNLKTIITSLKSSNSKHAIVLTVPPKANENTWNPKLASYDEYKKAVYELALEFKCPVADYSVIDFVGNGWYSDGVHPNNDGHFAMAKVLTKTLDIPL